MKQLQLLFVLFLLVSTLWLPTVPGLMGDEASEGENVYQILEVTGFSLIGERSYIGPAMDYVRLPFISLIGYRLVALRLPILVFSVISFCLAWSIFKKLFGEEKALIIQAVTFFSPIYLTYARLSWAITLYPFFALLIIWLLLSDIKYKYLIAGIVAGLGLHNHILFLPTILAVLFVTALSLFLRDTSRSPQQGARSQPQPRSLALFLRARTMPARLTHGLLRKSLNLFSQLLFFGLGLLLAFSTQLVALRRQTEDQGDPAAVAAMFWERLQDFPSLLPVIMSGSSYIARYTGVEFFGEIQWTVTIIVLILILFAIFNAGERRKITILWLLGILVHLVVMIVMVDRFTLRYFWLFTLASWAMAAFGLSSIITKIAEITNKANSGDSPIYRYMGLLLGVVLSLVFIGLVLVPFNITGGSANDFSLGNRTNSAIDLADHRPLVECLENAGTVSSGNPHVYNRLLFLSHSNSALQVLPEENLGEAKFEAHYRKGDAADISASDQLCPDLKHFVVAKLEVE